MDGDSSSDRLTPADYASDASRCSTHTNRNRSAVLYFRRRSAQASARGHVHLSKQWNLHRAKTLHHHTESDCSAAFPHEPLRRPGNSRHRSRLQVHALNDPPECSPCPVPMRCRRHRILNFTKALNSGRRASLTAEESSAESLRPRSILALGSILALEG